MPSCREPARRSGRGRLPRPAAPDEAMELAENAAEAASAPWIGARDLAILLLLYGAGLRVAEALSLTARALPIGATLRVTGKRSKTRIVPVVPAVREAIEDYVRQCPYPLSGDDALVRRRAWRAAQSRSRAARRWRRRGGGWGFPTR